MSKGLSLQSFMVLEIVQYGHPSLRAKGRPIHEIDAGTKKLAKEMLETMYEADGVGLAAQQVGMPVQLCVVDVSNVKDRPSAMRVHGKSVMLEDFMPLILINPEVRALGRPHTAVEGCLSFPGLRADITRPFSARVKAQTLDGQVLEFEADGLLARALQHEHDHLQGILFIDHMSAAQRKTLGAEIEHLRTGSVR